MTSKFSVSLMACLGLIASAAFADTAFAQVPKLAIPADKDWQHDWTSMEFPAEIGGFQRQSVSQFEERQTNVGGQYYDENSKTFLTLYIYRPGNPTTSIWFDRALIPIGASEQYGSVDLDQMKIGTFVPNGANAASGMFAVIGVEGRIRSTALSMYRAGEWLIKLRISSERLSVEEMNALRIEIQDGLPEMEGIDAFPAYFIEECQSPLTTKQATPFNDPKGDTALALEAAVSLWAKSLEGTDEADGDDDNPGVYCREGTRRDRFNLYRLNESVDSYYTAVGDAGAGFSVFPKSLYGAEPGGASAVSVHRVESADGLFANIHRPFVGMPNLQQAAEAVYRQPMLAKVSRPLGDEGANITLLTSPEGEDPPSN